MGKSDRQRGCTRGAAAPCPRPGLVGARLDLDLPVDSHAGDRASGHRTLGGGEEAAEAGQQRDRDGNAGGRRGQPATSATQKPERPRPDHDGTDRRGARVQSAVAHRPPVGETGGDDGVVRGDDQGGASGVRGVQQDTDHSVGVTVIRLAGGFVGKDHRGAGGHHPRNRDPLCLPTGQLVGQFACQITDPDQIERCARAVHSVCSASPANSSGRATFSVTSRLGSRLGP